MKLPEPVKRFIELNIDFIEQEDWYKVFVNWYTNGDDYYLMEFLEALEAAGIDISGTESTRRMIVEQMSTAILSKHLLTAQGITRSSMDMSLKSDLGLSFDDVQFIFDKVAKNAGLIKSTNGWYRL